jgi:hypothetical protein
MKRLIIVAAVVFLSVSPVHALYSVSSHGDWPDTWPKELEPLREQSYTLVGPTWPFRHYVVAFTKREEFEAAWPHILAVKSQGAPIVLRHGLSFGLGGESKPCVCIHTPPMGQAPAAYSGKAAGRYMTTYIELIVDGEIVDLNRILLPPDTPIIDERSLETQDSTPAKETESEKRTP